jgi:hypothetical protein
MNRASRAAGRLTLLAAIWYLQFLSAVCYLLFAVCCLLFADSRKG